MVGLHAVGAPYQPISLYHLFSSMDNVAFQEMFASSGDIFMCHNFEGPCYWHLVGRETRDAAKHPAVK